MDNNKTRIKLELADYDTDISLSRFAKRLRDTADILDSLCCARPRTEDDFLNEDFILEFSDRNMEPLRPILTLENDVARTEGSSLIGAQLSVTTSKDTRKDMIGIFTDALTLILMYPHATIKQLAELSLLASSMRVCQAKKNFKGHKITMQVTEAHIREKMEELWQQEKEWRTHE